ncbi:hypothetical protein [Phytohabitans houttuyneae]|uniref:Uncharacterized protein n=1 Tax=Phytohabitans houttuyneae TaxID=1076126 RepID=A0A6V8KFP5_9ACTN|nr:hypothetical protein [Phytohabitans houttuyneae]GFJ79555.1 hypothetical protein Phou_037350 [Phytohabitans houttuyneae]
MNGARDFAAAAGAVVLLLLLPLLAAAALLAGVAALAVGVWRIYMAPRLAAYRRSVRVRAAFTGIAAGSLADLADVDRRLTDFYPSPELARED